MKVPHGSQRQDGQSLILIALLMVAMIAFAGLVIDGGNAYAMRRRAQNAADAGALAGAQELGGRYVCNAGGSALDDTAIAKRINEYAERNGVADSSGVAGDATNTNLRRRYIDKDGNEINVAQDIGQVGYVPVNAVGVRVVPAMQSPTFFMRIMGFNEVTVAASAEACVGTLSVAGGAILPIAVQEDIFDWAVTGTNIRIWGKDGDGEVENPNDSSGTQKSQRGWLNLSYVFSKDDPRRATDKDHSNAKLKYWCCNNYPNLIYAGDTDMLNGDFINGDPGTRTSSVAELDCRIGQVALIPIYDYVYSPNYLKGRDFTEPEAGWISPGNQGVLYHIVGFATVKINALGTQGNEKYIQAEFVKAVFGGSITQGVPGGLCKPLARGIGLTR